MRPLVFLLVAVGCGGAAPTPGSGSVGTSPAMTRQDSGTKVRLQALFAVDENVVWASGLGGTFTVTLDGGATWKPGVVPGAETLEFRDVAAASATSATLLASGPGPASRIYHTEDGGATWTLQQQNQDPKGFYDCLATFAGGQALVMTDSVDGRLPVLATTDGKTWSDIGDRLPAAQPGEAAFAASGTCIAALGGQLAWIATGGGARARVLYTIDGGASWRSASTPILQGSETSGGTSIAFRDAEHGVLGGGDIRALTAPAQNFARSRDGGRSWQLGTATPFPGPIFGLAYAGATTVVVATGPSGSAVSMDEGQTWSLLAGAKDFWAVGFASARRGWLVGTDGRVVRIDF
jgi:photosystem II stability/assembly factor-like uncharacterized protein